jgi:hypothetical protein
MIHKTVESGKFPAKYVGVDSAYGSNHAFLDSLPEELIYFADIHSNISVFTSRPGTYFPEYSGRGRRPTGEKPEFTPISAKKLVENANVPWSKVVLGIGTKGPIITEDKILRVVEVRNGLPGKDVWLYARKLEDGSIKYALCNASADATAEEIRKPALMRWSIEQCFKECKDFLGMDHYESRSWDAWYRHMLLTFIAHLFISKLRAAFSNTPNTPCIAPFIETPVEFDDYIDAFSQLTNNLPISHADISAMPTKPQRFLTIGLIQKLVSSAFVKIGVVMEEINYSLYKARSAFDSHSRITMDKALHIDNDSLWSYFVI